jgi:HSP20 family protein
MSTLQQVKNGVRRAWHGVVDGWQQLYHRADNAITRFSISDNAEDSNTLASMNAGWAVLASEIYDDDDKVVVRLEAPGMTADDFSVEIVENYLLIRGQKNIEREYQNRRYHVLECAYGRFERAIPLPEEVNPDEAKARYKHGVLKVELAKVTALRRHTINVHVH